MNLKIVNRLLTVLLISQFLVNLIGALGPELGFDALWYHLTEAQLFLNNHSLFPIKGNLLYWSGLPRLAEILFALALKIWDERLAKLLHLLAGVLSTWLLYRLGKKQNKTVGLVAANLFYTTLLVGWLSTTAYIDLFVVCFFLLALNAKNRFQQALSLILLGATKLTAVGYFLAVTFIPYTLLGLLPFMLINYLATNNPFYPFFTGIKLTSEWFFNGIGFWLSRPLRLFFDPSFRVGPILLVLLLTYFKTISWKPYFRALIVTFLFWVLGPGTDFGRFAIPFLAVLSLIVAGLFNRKKVVIDFALLLVVLQSLAGIGSRFYANLKYLPVIMGKQTKADFLAHNLKFHFGDFYDIDGWFADNLRPSDKVLIYNLHNLYYVSFNYDHQSWSQPHSDYTHVLVGDNAPLPPQYSFLPLVYQNPTTRVKLYKLP